MKTVTRDRIGTLRYRKHFIAADQRQIRIVIAASTIALTLTIRNDLMLVAKPILYALFIARAVHAMMTGYLYAVLSKPQSLRKLEIIANTWNLTSTALMVFIGLSRLGARELQGPFLGTMAFICIFYFAQRGYLFTRVLSCFTISGILLQRLLDANSNASPTARTTGITLLVLLNILGLATNRSFEQQRRARHDAEREEKRIRLQLIAKNRDLEIQKSRAEALYRSRTAFLAAMSHEFRTPMNAVIGLSDVLANAPLAPEYRDHARVIRESASALLVVLNDVLDFAKIDAGKLELNKAPFQLRMLVNSVVEMMRPVARAKNIALITRLAENLPEYVMGDDARLRQVLVNLLSNAIKFTSRGSVTLDIDANKVEEEVSEIVFSVSDTGIGMCADVLARLFRPFEQGDSGVGRRFGGTGLGLVISQRIVDALGGQIRVESDVGKGSTFSFTLRMTETNAPALRAPSSPEMVLIDRQSLAILVVDDVNVNRTVAKVMLARLGYRADLAENGAAAIEAVAKKKYDIVLMDLQMPGMSGIETTKAIVEKLGPNAPTMIAMSASVFEEDRLACQNAGMRDFIAKPINIEQLNATLTRWVPHGDAPTGSSRQSVV
jgi:signal transduction histidine kinase/ActR/RegA family two-component response regulator